MTRGPGPPVFLDQTEAQRAKKVFGEDCPHPSFTLGSGWPPTPLSQSLVLALKFSKLILKHFLEELVERIWWKTKAFPFGDLFLFS